MFRLRLVFQRRGLGVSSIMVAFQVTAEGRIRIQLNQHVLSKCLIAMKAGHITLYLHGLLNNFAMIQISLFIVVSQYSTIRGTIMSKTSYRYAIAGSSGIIAHSSLNI